MRRMIRISMRIITLILSVMILLVFNAYSEAVNDICINVKNSSVAYIDQPYTFSFEITGGSGKYRDISVEVQEILKIGKAGTYKKKNVEYSCVDGVYSFTPTFGTTCEIVVGCFDAVKGFGTFQHTHASIKQNPDIPVSFSFTQNSYEAGEEVQLQYSISGLSSTPVDSTVSWIVWGDETEAHYGVQKQKVTASSGSVSITPSFGEHIKAVIEGKDSKGHFFYAISDTVDIKTNLLSTNIEGLNITYDKSQVRGGDTIAAYYRISKDGLRILNAEWNNIAIKGGCKESVSQLDKEGTLTFVPKYNGYCYLTVKCADAEGKQYTYRSDDFPVHGMTMRSVNECELLKDKQDPSYRGICPGEMYVYEFYVDNHIGQYHYKAYLVTRSGNNVSEVQDFNNAASGDKGVLFIYVPDDIDSFYYKVTLVDANDGLMEFETEPVQVHKTHTSLTKTDENKATCTEPGTEAYWTCNICHKMFCDEKCTIQITEPITTNPNGHSLKKHDKVFPTRDTDGMEEYWECSECHILYDEYGTIIPKPVIIPKTGTIIEQDQTSVPTDKPGPKPTNKPEPEPADKVEAFVARCYSIILGREPDAGGMRTWYNELVSGRKAASEIIDNFVRSQEFLGKHYSNADAVEILYKAMLGRGSDPAGKADWVGRLAGGQPLTAIINGFCGSMEFTAICEAYGITPGSVKVENLSRAAEETAETVAPKTEKKANLVEITNASDTVNENLGTAVQAIYINEEKAKEFIGRCYRAILGREAGAEELDGWIGQMMNGSKTADQIARGFLFSGEFKGRNIGNEELVKILYRVYMNREADAEGLATWTQKLDEGTSLNDLLNVFAKTGEFKNVVRAMGE